MRFLLTSCLILCNIFLQGFQTRPWLGDFLEFHLIPSFMYRHYPSVDGAYHPSSYSSNDRFTNIKLDLGLDPWELELGIEFADTRKQSLGTQSAGGQVRYRFWNDISGDVLSFVSGLNVRWVSKRSLHDVSCPYHAEWNFELANSLGKEWQLSETNFLRTYGFLGVGQAIKGRPWVRAIISIEALLKEHHRLGLLGEGYFGFGKTKRVNIDDFDGYANIFHQSIDVGAVYAYKISNIWGEITLAYSYRVFAKDFPAHANTLLIQYNFPFSIF